MSPARASASSDAPALHDGVDGPCALGEERAEPTAEARERRFAAMFDAHHDVVWRTLRRLGAPPSQVDDATQRVFLVAVRRLDEIRVGDESRFLYGVALRVASEMRRRDPARRYADDDGVLDRLVDPTPRADEELIERDARAALDEVLAGMPDDLRQVLVLVELEGLTVAVVAELLGVPAGTAASRIRRAREAFSAGARRLRARLERGAR